MIFGLFFSPFFGVRFEFFGEWFELLGWGLRMRESECGGVDGGECEWVAVWVFYGGKKLGFKKVKIKKLWGGFV